MGAIGPCELPSQALLARYGPPKDFVDAYRCELARTVTQAEYVEQFYRSAAFRPERLLLGLFGTWLPLPDPETAQGRETGKRPRRCHDRRAEQPRKPPGAIRPRRVPRGSSRKRLLPGRDDSLALPQRMPGRFSPCSRAHSLAMS